MTETIAWKKDRDEVQVSREDPLPVSGTVTSTQSSSDLQQTTFSQDRALEILIELRVISRLLAEGFIIADGLDDMRNDEIIRLGEMTSEA